MDYAALKTLIESTPACAGKAPEEIADVLNTATLPGFVPISEINAWADGEGITPVVRRLLRLTDEQIKTRFGLNDVQLDQLLVCLFAAVGLFDASYTQVDFDAYATKLQQMAGGLAGAQIITQQQAAAFLALGANRRSLAEKHLGAAVTDRDVIHAQGL